MTVRNEPELLRALSRLRVSPPGDGFEERLLERLKASGESNGLPGAAASNGSTIATGARWWRPGRGLVVLAAIAFPLAAAAAAGGIWGAPLWSASTEPVHTQSSTPRSPTARKGKSVHRPVIATPNAVEPESEPFGPVSAPERSAGGLGDPSKDSIPKKEKENASSAPGTGTGRSEVSGGKAPLLSPQRAAEPPLGAGLSHEPSGSVAPPAGQSPAPSTAPQRLQRARLHYGLANGAATAGPGEATQRRAGQDSSAARATGSNQAAEAAAEVAREAKGTGQADSTHARATGRDRESRATAEERREQRASRREAGQSRGQRGAGAGR